MLAVGLALFCLRYLIPHDRWPDRLAKISFWSLNIGLAWMTFATLFPLGLIQLYESVDSGYYAARSLEFLTNDTNSLIEWIRLPGDILFIGGGVLPLLYVCYLGVRHRVGRTTLGEGDEILFTEITAPTPDSPAAVTPMRARGAAAMSLEALLATAYAAFLMLAATGLDLLARHSHRRAGRYRTAGFTFRPDLDLWDCPEGQQLRRVDTDHRRRLAHYRASPAVCNACPVKSECTDSDHGRQITQALDPWPHSEAGRFHRGVGVVLVVLAAVIAGLALIRSQGTAEAVVLATVLGIAAATAGRLLGDFRRTPTGFPGASATPP